MLMLLAGAGAQSSCPVANCGADPGSCVYAGKLFRCKTCAPTYVSIRNGLACGA